MKIVINITDRKFSPGLRLSKDYPELFEEFSWFMANMLVTELKRAINNQRYLSKWPPLTIEYLKYKQVNNLSLNIWEATGELKNSIVVMETNNTYTVGIDPRKRYKDSGVLILDVAKWMEYGTSKMPPRPLFRPIVTYIQKNIRRYWRKFLLEEKGIF